MHATSAQFDHDDAHVHTPYVRDYFLGKTTAVNQLSPSMIRVLLKIEAGERLNASGHPDEWIRLALQPDPDTPVTLPVVMENGKWGRPDGSRDCPNRPYTIRRWDPDRCEMTIDLVVHQGGVAAEWATRAKVGDVVGVCNPEGRFWIPKGSEWLLILTDITGLPATGRILEELPAGFRTIVHAEVPSDDDRQEITTAADLSIHWHPCHGVKPYRSGHTELASIACRINELPDGPGYIYIAGEARAVSDSRKHFRDVLGFDKDRIDAIGYWIEGQARV